MFFEFCDVDSRIVDLVCLDNIAHVDINANYNSVLAKSCTLAISYYSGLVVNIVTTIKQKDSFVKHLILYKNNVYHQLNN